MDVMWARSALEEYDKLIASYSSYLDSDGFYDDDGYGDFVKNKLLRAEATARSVLGQLTIESAGSLDGLPLHARRELVSKGLGLLDAISVRNKIDDPGATATLDGLHPAVLTAATPYWTSQHYGQAALECWKAINGHLQALTGSTHLSDRSLVDAVLSPGPVSRAAKLFLGQACVAGIRNVLAHDHTHQPSEQEAREYLHALSLFARWMDECTLESPLSVD